MKGLVIEINAIKQAVLVHIVQGVIVERDILELVAKAMWMSVTQTQGHVNITATTQLVVIPAAVIPATIKLERSVN